MADGLRYHVLLSSPAKRDLVAVMRWSADKFGESAAARYETLIVQAIRDLSIDPSRPGSKTLPELMVANARIYPLFYSRPRVSGTGVKSPRHLLLYMLQPPATVVVARILHDSRDLKKHLPKSYKLT